MKELTLQEIQHETLAIMKVIDKICRTENIKYVLFYGTLLGAVRHKGFIPWDDDLDIAMPRADYEKLALYFCAHKEELAPYAWFSYKTVENYPYMIARVCNTDFRMEAENEGDCGMGTFIDVYPMDGAGNGNHTFLYNKAWFYSSMYYTKNRQRYVIKPKGILKRIVKRAVVVLAKLHSIDFIRKKLFQIAYTYPYEASDCIASMTWLVYGKRNVFRKEDIENVVDGDFEGEKYFIPSNYHRILTDFYGDYMKLPSENERVGHHFYKIYRK